MVTQKVCPPEATAPVPERPLPPEGIDANAVTDALIAYLGPEKGLEMWLWLMARENPTTAEIEARLKAVHAACVSE